MEARDSGETGGTSSVVADRPETLKQEIQSATDDWKQAVGDAEVAATRELAHLTATHPTALAPHLDAFLDRLQAGGNVDVQVNLARVVADVAVELTPREVASRQESLIEILDGTTNPEVTGCLIETLTPLVQHTGTADERVIEAAGPVFKSKAPLPRSQALEYFLVTAQTDPDVLIPYVDQCIHLARHSTDNERQTFLAILTYIGGIYPRKILKDGIVEALTAGMDAGDSTIRGRAVFLAGCILSDIPEFEHIFLAPIVACLDDPDACPLMVIVPTDDQITEMITNA